MMEHVLFAAAEQQELDRAKAAYGRLDRSRQARMKVDFLLTGIGTTSTAYRLTRTILEAEAAGCPFTLLIDLGIAGSYDLEQFPLCSAVVISGEHAGDLGFDTAGGFKTLFDYGAWNPDAFPYEGGILKRPVLPQAELERWLGTCRSGTGVTVQTVTGNPARLDEICRKYRPAIESMEGAAFYFVALHERIPFFELRTVSNAVGDSDSSRWETLGALDSLEKACVEIFNVLVG